MMETTKIKIELWLTFDEIELIHKTLKEYNQTKPVIQKRGLKGTNKFLDAAISNKVRGNTLDPAITGDKLFS